MFLWRPVLVKPARDIRSVLQEAMALHQQGHAQRAESMYHEVLAIHPQEPNAWHLLGVAAWQRGDLATAETNIRKAIGFNRGAAAYYCNLGGVLRDRKDFAAAVEAYRGALAVEPTNAEGKKGLAESYNKLGLNLAGEYKWDEAKAVYRRLLEINPDDAGALNNLAQIFHHAGEEKEALALYDRALAANPNYLIARFNRGICRLGENMLPEGWQDLAGSSADWLPRMDKRENLPWHFMPMWDGQDVRGKKILIWGDQGVGDEIIFAGMIPDLLARGARVTFECEERLLPLFRRSFPGITAIARQNPPLPGTEFDYQATVLWLGRYLRPDFDSFPSRSSYLEADAEKTAALRARYASDGKKVIGVSWHSKTRGYGVSRRIDLRELAAVLPRDAVYVDLQYGDTAVERAETAREFPDFDLRHDDAVDSLKDLDAFAAQVAACDLVVTIGNTPAHMAGALGIPGFVLLPIAGRTWYWFRDRTDSPWYPSLKLFWKSEEGSWDKPLASLREALASASTIFSPPSGDEDARRRLGESLHRHGMEMMKELRLEEAKAAFHRVLDMDPDNIAALNNLAMIIQHEGDRPGARRLYDHALKVAPDNLAMRYNRSIGSLTEGRLEEGWADFSASEPHWRDFHADRPDLPWMRLPLWNNEDIRGKKILLWGTYGIGDEIVYMSMVPELLARGAKVTIECMDRLVPLAERSFPAAAVVPREAPPLPGGDFDFHAPWMWLARCLRPDMESFPRNKSFLKADPEKTAKLRARYEAFGKKRIVGLSWFTLSPAWGLKRSIPLPDMLAPLKLDDLLIVDLQYGDAGEAWKEAQRVFPNLSMIHDHEVDQFRDMDMFAAQIAACDFVYTISNTTSHVAGALGVPACVLMPHEGLTWYWFESGEECPWYPSLRLLRPTVPDRLKTGAAMASGSANGKIG